MKKPPFLQKEFVIGLESPDGALVTQLRQRNDHVEVKQGDDIVFVPVGQAKAFHAVLGEYIESEVLLRAAICEAGIPVEVQRPKPRWPFGLFS